MNPWLVAVYLLLIVGWLRRIRGTGKQQPVSRRWAAAAFARRIEPLLKHTARVDALLGKAVAQYEARWVEAGRAFITQHTWQERLDAAARETSAHGERAA